MSSWPLSSKPFSVQLRALERSDGARGYLYLMEQGLAKTATTLVDYVRWHAAGKVDVLAVVCPNSLKGNWPIESATWGLGLKWAVWPDDDRVTLKHDAFVINYEAVISSGGEALAWLCRNRRTFLVLDECHRIKNPTAQITRKLIGDIAKDAIVKRGLTGTPMTNTVIDLWPQLRLAGGLEGVQPRVFRNRFAQTGGYMGKSITGIKAGMEETLWKLVDRHGFRALKTDWLDLPPKMYREQQVPLPKTLRGHYQTMMEEFIVELDNDECVTAEMVISKLIKLQQISSGFILGEGGVVHTLCPIGKLPKYNTLCDILDANGKTSKTLIFCHFRNTADNLIQSLTNDFGEPPACIKGGMKPAEVEQQKALFNSSSGPQMMVLQLSAGKEGHTLLGCQKTNPCHTVVYYENNFNLGDRLQSEDRAHRIGQQGSVLYVDLVGSPIEALTRAAVTAKKSLVDLVIDKKRALIMGDNK